MTPLQTYRHNAATELLDLIDHTTPDQRALARPERAFPAVDAIVDMALSMAVAHAAHVVQEVLQTYAADHKPPTNEPNQPRQ